jgi:hypothetical protein
LRQVHAVHYADKSVEWARQQMVLLHRNGYVERFSASTQAGAVPQVFVLDRGGWELLVQEGLVEATKPGRFTRREPARNDGKTGHDLRANAWVIALLEAWHGQGQINEEWWYGPMECKLTPPRSARDVAHARERLGVQGDGAGRVAEIHPDAAIAVPTNRGLRFVFVEYERTGYRHSKHLPDKFAKYDTFLTYWWRNALVGSSPLEAQPKLVVVADDEHVLGHVARHANERFTAYTTDLDFMHQRHRSWAGRQAVHLALADDVHRGRIRLWALPHLGAESPSGFGAGGGLASLGEPYIDSDSPRDVARF